VSPLHPELVILVLVAALMHATWNALIKASGERGATFSVVVVVGGVGGLAGVLVLPLPDAAAWPYLVLSMFVHYGYYGFLMLSYRHGDLSHVYPLARGAAPLLVALGALVFAGERLSVAATAGLLLASAGIMSLAFERGLPRGGDLKPVLFALGTGVLIAFYTVVDGLGVRASAAPLSYIFWLQLVEGLPLTLWLLWRRPTSFFGQSGKSWRRGIGGGVLAFLAYGLVIYAMSRGGLAQVSALRETSTLFAALIGAYVLKESPGGAARRIAAAGMVAAGVIALQLG
jgi:drug/metabolite transporter (DMT)-like permease